MLVSCVFSLSTKACFNAEADVELSFENFFGLVKGVSALYFLATFALEAFVFLLYL